MPQLEWCPNCGEPTSRLNNYTGWCPSCSSSDPYAQLEIYLENNADHIEHYMAKGNTVFQAVLLIRSDTRPSCLTCGDLLSHAPRHSIFCSKRERCRKASNRYRYLYKQKGLSKSEALAKVSEEFNE